jgi:hypothetical protein
MNKLPYEQGDVLFHLDPIPKNAARKKFNGVVQHGEHTGHSHRLVDPGFEYFETPEKTRHLRIVTPTRLLHEEHKEILINPGEYRIGIVREYDHFEEEAREVVD